MAKMTATTWLKITIVAAVLYFLSLLTAIYLPIILSVILAFILNPLVNWLGRMPLGLLRYRLSRPVAILAAFLLSAALLSMLLSFILVPFVEEFNRFIIYLPDKVRRLMLILERQVAMPAIPEVVRGAVDQALSSAASFSVDLARRLINGSFSLATQIVELVVVPVLAFYLLKDWQELRESFISLVPHGYKQKVREVIGEMAAVMSGYIRGQALVSVIIGLIVFSGLYFFNIDYPLVLGLLAALTETIPIIGPIIGAAPAVLLAYLVSPALAAKVAVFYIIVQQIENHIIVPKVMGRSIDLHPIAVIISLLIGGQLMGVVGMILAVPAAAILKVLAKHIWYYEER
ncbi:MAG: AI-2E family transporter [Negativicutes bacterium]|nr:AI-2E family transporter [Negativicutes bacterium]